MTRLITITLELAPLDDNPNGSLPDAVFDRDAHIADVADYVAEVLDMALAPGEAALNVEATVEEAAVLE